MTALLKSAGPERGPWVRIPPPPPFTNMTKIPEYLKGQGVVEYRRTEDGHGAFWRYANGEQCGYYCPYIPDALLHRNSERDASTTEASLTPESAFKTHIRVYEDPRADDQPVVLPYKGKTTPLIPTKKTTMIETLVFGKENPPQIEAGEILNTFRVGSKWAELVEPGQLVKLREYGDDQPYGIALVVDVELGKWDDVKELAELNQTWRDLPQAEAELHLLVELARVYPEFDPVEDEISVLTYVRLEAEQEAFLLDLLDIAHAA
jgi:hypothetical protein